MNPIKQLFLLILSLLFQVIVVAQNDTFIRDSPPQQRVRSEEGRPTPNTQVQSDSLSRDSRLIDTASLLIDSVGMDSIQTSIPVIPLHKKDTSTYAKYLIHPYLPLTQKPMFMISNFRERRTLDDLFYLLMGVLLLLAFIRSVFPRYFKNLFILFFQTSLRQKQTRDQLLQDNLGSVFVNLLFIICASIYGALIIRHKEWLDYPFWHIIFFGAGLLSVVYFGKFLFLRFAGWVFNSREAAMNYTFTVFLVNKVLGISLVPFLFLMAFSKPSLREVAFTVSIGLTGLLLLYRYVISFSNIRNTLKVNALHFFLYLCAVEILPLLVLYKLMADYIGGRF
ncbi:MAG: DUF4271 domain-containing protein [Chitinophagaceae bacterium]|nr:DUF4271 domain-containing protein [Chitinophagaceae bacterium]